MKALIDRIRSTWRSGCLGKLFLLLALLILLFSCCTGLMVAFPTKPTPTPGLVMPTRPPASLVLPTLTSAPLTALPTATQPPAAVVQPSYTPNPTYTPAPTPAPTLTPHPTATPKPANTPAPTYTPAPTLTPRPTATPTNTRVPTPKPSATPMPQPVTLSGSGQFASNSITLPAPLCRAIFTHRGSANFIVYSYQAGAKDLLVNAIGNYDGARPLSGTDPIVLDIQADGDWTVSIEPVSYDGSPPFSGHGDSVSQVFSPPAAGAWEISHDGQENFIVYAHCAGGSTLVQNEIGPVSGSRVISFERGPCFWEVRADGNWSLKPRQ